MSELPYEDIKVGDEASLTRTITEVHIVNYAGLTGDWNPVHADAEHAAQSMFGERIAHGMLVLSYAVGLVEFDPERVLDIDADLGREKPQAAVEMRAETRSRPRSLRASRRLSAGRARTSADRRTSPRTPRNCP